jgi:hypothetical protein
MMETSVLIENDRLMGTPELPVKIVLFLTNSNANGSRNEEVFQQVSL